MLKKYFSIALFISCVLTILTPNISLAKETTGKQKVALTATVDEMIGFSRNNNAFSAFTNYGKGLSASIGSAFDTKNYLFNLKQDKKIANPGTITISEANQTIFYCTSNY